ncbi:MAG: two-component system response regulator [Sulfobacillus benefaciens]|jgi:two-component system chemotaxis response regulator CheY|uniref:Stage 0 sporulation protein A homolog n=1 Tax=Sulfobacillus benefaciens TaxID=453960 RepID=A0A2T2WWC2_9FIRM|nr:MAG: two-component system response regulator [Sulfobacillus benefaciens]HBQ95430.1 two-component system response regulator [Sulfobacillus sp.]
MRVLIVDDAAFMRLRLKKLLTQDGYEVEEAGNGQEAVEKYGALHPDCVLMDITMPEMSGIDALKAIKAEDPGANVIMVSALGQQAMVIQAIQHGARDFIVKPYEPERVLASLNKVLS